MSGRGRVLHTNISTDAKLGRLVSAYGSGLGLFYILLIPQASDDAIVHDADPLSLKGRVVPIFDQIKPTDIECWLVLLHNQDMIYWDEAEQKIYFPPQSFYRYQTKVAEDRQRKDHPIRLGALKSARKAATSDVLERFEAVWALVPIHARQRWTEHQIKEALLMYSGISAYDTKMVMLSVLEKFDGKRNDIGFLFANALRWKVEEGQEPGVLSGAITRGEYDAQYRRIQQTSEADLSDALSELETIMEEVQVNG